MNRYLVLLGLFMCSLGCNENRVENSTATSDGSEQYILSKKEKTIKEQLASEGDKDAAYDLSQHYEYSFLLSREINDRDNYMIWLKKAAYLRNFSAIGDLIHVYLSQGACEQARKVYDDAINSIPKNNNSFMQISDKIAQCFQRPVGDGDWATRKQKTS